MKFPATGRWPARLESVMPAEPFPRCHFPGAISPVPFPRCYFPGAIATEPLPRSQSVKLPVKIPVGFRVFYTVAMGDGKRKESE